MKQIKTIASTKLQYKNIKFAALAVAIATVLSCGSAFACGSGLITGVPPGVPESCSGINAELNITGTFNNAGTVVMVNATSGTAKLQSNDITITNSSSGYGLYVTGSVAAIVDMQGDNLIYLNNPLSDTGVFVNVDSSGTGDARLTIEGSLQLDNAGIDNAFFQKNGLALNNSGTGNAILNFTGTSSLIHTKDGNAIFVNLDGTASFAGFASVTLLKENQLETEGETDRASGIRVNITRRDASATVESDAGIKTMGASAHGIFTSIRDGQSTITNNESGIIRTSGNSALGINAFSNAGGNNIIKNKGIIETTGQNARGIQATAVATDAASNIISNDHGQIKTTGRAAIGIYAVNNSTNIASIANIISNSFGIITTVADGAHGIFANSVGSLNTITNKSGEVTTAGNNAIGIFSNSNSGTNFISNDFGIITTTASGAHGIYAVTINGDNTINNNAAGKIITRGNSAHGIYATTTDGDNTISNDSGEIQTAGYQAYGILAKTESGKIDISIDHAKITTKNGDAHAIYGDIGLANSSSGGSRITVKNSKLNTEEYQSNGIYLTSQASDGDMIFIVDNSEIDVKGYNSDGINVENFSTHRSHVNIDITTRQGKINVLDVTAASGGSNYGILVHQAGQAEGDVTIFNDRTEITTGLAGDNKAYDSSAIAVQLTSPSATGAIKVINQGKLETSGDRAYGITAINEGNGTIEIKNNSLITVKGNDSAGIVARKSAGVAGNSLITVITTTANQGNATIENTGVITTFGNKTHGILADSLNGDLTVTNRGSININGTESRGIYTRSATGSVTEINNTGAILHNENTPLNDGIEASVIGNNAEVIINHNGTIQGSRFGIVAWDESVDTTGNKSTINIGGGGSVDAIYGVIADLSAENTVNLANGGRINGSKHAIWFRGNDSEAHVSTLNNAGILTSNSDETIAAISNNGNTQLTINNQGTGKIVGKMSVYASQTTVNNNGLWEMQDRFNNTATVALGNNINNIFINQGIVNFNNKETIISGVNTFNMNGGLLNLRARPRAGEQVSIGQTVDPTTRTVTGGIFVADGGLINMDIALGNDQSVTDRIYVDHAIKGSNRQTRIYVNNDGGLGALTNEGIQIVNVKTASAQNAFVLANAVVAGAYEYALVYKTQTNGSEGWHLTSKAIDTGWDSDIPLYRPDSGVNIGNQQGVINGMIPGLGNNTTSLAGAGSSGGMRASVRLNSNFATMTNMSDSSANGNNNGQNGFAAPQKSNSFWSFATANTTKGKAANKQVDYTVDVSTLQIGADTSFDAGNGLIQFGLMAAYGKIETESQNTITRSIGNGKVTGYSVGIYGTWYANKDSMFSPYIDTYITHGWYDNEVSTSGNATAEYDSNATSVTIQAGYPIMFGSVVLEPQGQATYVYYRSKNYDDYSFSYTRNELNGNIIGRIGTYLYGASESRFKPYTVVNIWYDDTNSIVKYNDVTISSDKKGTTFEAKIGFQAQATPDLTFWGEVGIRRGKNNFKDFGGSVGLKYRF